MMPELAFPKEGISEVQGQCLRTLENLQKMSKTNKITLSLSIRERQAGRKEVSGERGHTTTALRSHPSF